MNFLILVFKQNFEIFTETYSCQFAIVKKINEMQKILYAFCPSGEFRPRYTCAKILTFGPTNILA